MKPTEYKSNYAEIRPISGNRLLHNLEQEGYELITPTEGMCYVDGKWQQLEQYQERFHAHHLCDETCPHPLFRLIRPQEET